jgi:hypothetical protein
MGDSSDLIAELQKTRQEGIQTSDENLARNVRRHLRTLTGKDSQTWLLGMIVLAVLVLMSLLYVLGLKLIESANTPQVVVRVERPTIIYPITHQNITYNTEVLKEKVVVGKTQNCTKIQTREKTLYECANI